MLYPTKTFVQSYIQRKHEQVCWYLKARNSFSGKDQFKQEVKRGHEWDGCQCQVLCNAVLALGLGFLYLLDLGSADLPVVFRWVSDIQTFCSECSSLQVPLPRQMAGRGGAGGGLLLQWHLLQG